MRRAVGITRKVLSNMFSWFWYLKCVRVSFSLPSKYILPFLQRNFVPATGIRVSPFVIINPLAVQRTGNEMCYILTRLQSSWIWKSVYWQFYWRFGGYLCFRLQSQSEEKKNITEIFLKMEAVNSFETSVTNYRWTRHHVPDEGDPNSKALKNSNQAFLSLYSVFRIWLKTYVCVICYCRKSNTIWFP